MAYYNCIPFWVAQTFSLGFLHFFQNWTFSSKCRLKWSIELASNSITLSLDLKDVLLKHRKQGQNWVQEETWNVKGLKKGGQFDIPKSHFSERFLFRTFFIPKGFYSERSFLRTVFGPLIRKAYNPKGHCSKNFNSEIPLFRTVFDTKGFYSGRGITPLYPTHMA